MSKQSIDLSQSKLLNNIKNKNMNVIKKKRKKKIKCVCCSRILRPDESLEKIVANDRMIFLSSVHPPVILGHKNCIQSPITTPKHKGFLLDLENYGVIIVLLTYYLIITYYTAGTLYIMTLASATETISIK